MTEAKDLNQKLADLDAAIEWFYSDEFKLEDATKRYQAAVKLAKDIEQDLSHLQNQIEVLAKDFSK